VHNIGVIRHEQEAWSKAITVISMALERAWLMFGDEHRLTIKSRRNSASYRKLDYDITALSLIEHALRTSEQGLGLGHEETGSCLQPC
jgi:hypothetical protein